MNLSPLNSHYSTTSELILQTIQRLGTKDDVIEIFELNRDVDVFFVFFLNTHFKVISIIFEKYVTNICDCSIIHQKCVHIRMLNVIAIMLVI